MRRSAWWLLGAAGGWLSVSGCGGPTPPETSTTGQAPAPIIGGVLDDDADAHEAVVFMITPVGGCTAALVAPNLLVTAWHCVGNPLASGIGCDVYGNSTNDDHVGFDFTPAYLEIYIGAQPHFWSEDPVAVGQQILHGEGKVLCDLDIAFVVLDQPILGIDPLPIRTAFSPQPGELLTVVGYGQTNPNSPSSAGDRYRRENVSVLSTGMDWNYLQGGTEFSLTQSSCQGDSGGPSLAQSSGAVVGVVSRGGDCITDSRLQTGLHGHEALIDEAFAAAGAEPILEGEPAPPPIELQPTGHGPCESGYECLWFLCTGQGSDSLCSQFCDPEKNSCPAGTYCRPAPAIISGELGEVPACMPVPQDGSCEECRALICELEFQICLADEACANILACADQCSDDGCREACVAAQPSGAAFYQELHDCACEHGCADDCTECTLPPGAGGSGGGGGSAGGGTPTGGSPPAAPPTPSSDADDDGCSVRPLGPADSPSGRSVGWALAVAGWLAARRRLIGTKRL